MTDKAKESRQPRITLALLDFEMRSRLQTVLSNAGYDVVAISQQEELAGLIASAEELRSYKLAIWDVEMLDEEAVRRIEVLQVRGEFPPLIPVTAFSTKAALQRMASLETEADFDSPLDTYHQLAVVLKIVPT